MSERIVVRPRKLTRVCVALAVVVLIFFAVLSYAVGSIGSADPTRPVQPGTGQITFRLGDQLGLFGIGALVALGLLAFTRARVEADADGITIRNVLGDKTLPWQVVRAVRLDEGSPWASLDLHDDDTVALLAVQANDGDAAVDAVLGLRRLLSASRGEGPKP